MQTMTQKATDMMVEANIALTQKTLDEWAAQFKNDPVYALKRSAPVFAAAAHLRVWQEVEHYLTKITVTEVVELLRGRVLDRARYPSSSSSQSHNLMDRDMLAAQADVISALSYAVRQETKAAAGGGLNHDHE